MRQTRKTRDSPLRLRFKSYTITKSTNPIVHILPHRVETLREKERALNTKVIPTEAELAILRVLWSNGASTVRTVHELLGGDSRTRYTTTLKQLQVMTDKELVNRDESQRSHVYTAAVEEQVTEQSLVAQFLQRVLGGSARKMVMHALDSDTVSDEELNEIKQMLQRRSEK